MATKPRLLMSMREAAISLGTAMMDRGLLPDPVIRLAIRRLCADRLRQESQRDQASMRSTLQRANIAEHTDAANRQHYELPARFFEIVLGPKLKYSSCYFKSPSNTLAEAEDAALAQTLEHARLKPGMRVLDLGCGWGSFSLYAAALHPECTFVGVSNSHTQRQHIEAQVAQRGLQNLEIRTMDANDLVLDGEFQRVVSVEMLEHVKNHRALIDRLSKNLAPQALMMVHVFCHRQYSYPFETEGPANWMGRNFFTGGLMPGRDLLPEVTGAKLIERWDWPGSHYALTAQAWLDNMDAHRDEILELFDSVYREQAAAWVQRWRTFFLCCVELFGYDEGRQWGVSHYLLQPE